MNKKTVTLKNGETYAYIEQGKGDQTLLLVHGNLSSSVYFKPLLERLPKELHVVAIDLRGFGDSSYLNKFDSLANLATDIALFMSELKIDNANVLGWSLGGGVVLELASRYPKLVKKLILLNSTTHKGYPIFKKDATFKPIFTEGYASKSELATDPVQVKPVLEALATNNSAFMSYIYDLTIYSNHKPSKEDNDLYIAETMKQRCLVDADWALACLNMSNIPNLYTKGDGSIKNVTEPTLVISSALDKTVPEYMIQENLGALAHAKWIKYTESGHSPLVDNPDGLTKDILEFIK